MKSESRTSIETGNFFIETLGDIDKGEIGGPFRAARDGVTYFVVQFLGDGRTFWFDSQEVATALLDKSTTYYHKDIPNQEWGKKWTSRGIIVPQKDLIHLELKKDFFKTLKRPKNDGWD